MDSFMRGVCALTVILFLTFSPVSAAGSSGDTSTGVQIGAIYNLEGSQAPLDVPSSQGAMLAAEVFNKQNPDRPVNLTIKDGKSNESLMAPLTGELISRSDIQVIIGLSDTDMLIPAARAAAASNITFLTSGATSPRLPEEIGPYLYLACFGDNAQAAAAAEYAVNTLDAGCAAIYYDGTMNYTTLLAGYFQTRFKELGGEITRYERISPGAQSLGDDIKSLSEQTVPDIIYLAVGPDDAPDAVRKIRESGIQVPIFGGDSYDTKDLSRVAGLSGGGVYYTTHAFFGGENLTPEASDFVAAYQEKYGEMPDAFAGLGYDTVNLVLYAIGRNGDERDIRKGLSHIEAYQGVTGQYSYVNSSQIPQKSVTLMMAGDDIPEKITEIIPEKVPEL
jgi:branched-chain amino acid transport system substrate-binding protein